MHGRARAEADAAARRFTDLCTAVPVGIVLGAADGTIRAVNPALTDLLGFRKDDLVGKPLSHLAATGPDAAILTSAVDDQLSLPARRPRQERLGITHGRDGTLRARVTVGTLADDTDGGPSPVLVIEDVAELDLLGEQLRKQNTQDPLTGLPNAYHFDNRVDAALGSGGGRLALIYLDIDGFKVINDGLGPGAGDTVLQHVARTLKEQFVPHDAVVARMSGDGFAVLMRGAFAKPDVIDLVEEAATALAEPVWVEGTGVGVNVSVGIVVTDPDGRTGEELRRAAEITLHRAKENGKAQWMLFENDLHERDRRRYALGAAVGGALENGEFGVDYEPTVTLDGRDRVAVVNAVLRWDHPEHGALGPSAFCPLTDTTGMTTALGHHLLDTSVTDSAAWHTEFPETAPDLCVRLPTRFAIDPNLVGMVRDGLNRTGLPAHKLRICTDSVALSDPRGEALETLSVLSDLDVKITLAVTGAADLDLVRTHHLPVGFVVLTGHLIEALGEDDEAATRAHEHLRTLVEQARELGIHRIGAEGVHTGDQAARLRELGVVAGRGKLFGEAVTADGVRDLLAGGPRDARS
ncbi:diguanylate cyclase domain-containing protein [Saccharomonospora halophila]|uniref:diguanylate cyclase domain-containing protein n=1 Tax=Saccharomonospora halophila TaxID=129922 RepID=UPI00036D353C